MTDDTITDTSAYLPRTMRLVVSLLTDLAARGELRSPVPAPDDGDLVAGARQVNSVRPSWARYPALAAVHYLATQEAGRLAADAWASELTSAAQAAVAAGLPSIAATRQAKERVRASYAGNNDAAARASVDQLLASWRTWRAGCRSE